MRENAQLRLAVNLSDSESLQDNESALSSFLATSKLTAQLETSTFYHPSSPTPPSFTKSWIHFPFATSFSAKSYLAVPYSHPDNVRLQILAKLMTHHYLHREIREKNGAYGGGAGFIPLDGVFSMYSYRDPSAEKSVQAYENAVKWAIENRVSEQVSKCDLRLEMV